MFEFVVQGDPVPQGSMTAIPFHMPCPQCAEKKRYCGRAKICILPAGEVLGRQLRANIIHDNSGELKTWRSMIALEAKLAFNRAGMMARPVFPEGTGVVVGCVFFLKRPQGHLTSKGVLSADGLRNPTPCKKPDADKLLRGAVDAMSASTSADIGGEIYHDDNQVLSPWPWKTWAPLTARTGHTVIVIERADPSDIAAIAKVSARLIEIVRASRPSTGELFG
jgi:hypothetical protein